MKIKTRDIIKPPLIAILFSMFVFAAGQSFAATFPWVELERMELSERKNSEIDFLPRQSDVEKTSPIAREIEHLWNSGQFEVALELFRKSEELSSTKDINIGINWRNPILFEDDLLWGADVRIGTEDSIFSVALDIHRASGNLFAVVLADHDNYTSWHVYHSTDGGDTWNETYMFFGPYRIESISATVVDGHCYVAFSNWDPQTEAGLMRFRASDGARDTFPDGSWYVDVFSVINPRILEEVRITSNQDYNNNHLWYTGIDDAGNLHVYYNDVSNVIWFDNSPSMGNDYADRGLDVCTNEGWSNDYVWISYIDLNDSVEVYTRGNTGWSNPYAYDLNGSATQTTAIGAYQDTVTCVFGYYNTSTFTYTVRYLVSYDGGSTWGVGLDIDDDNTLHQKPDLTARDGGGVAIAYKFHSSPQEERYIWRDYSGSWTSAANISSHEPASVRPSIEYLGNESYGIVYVGASSPYGAAYFDKNSCCDVEMTPDSYPIFVPPGGSFGLTGTIGNPTGSPIDTDVWVGVEYSGSFYTLWQFNNIHLTAGQYISSHLNQTVPDYAPAGTYVYKAYCGDYPTDMRCDSAQFVFTVTAARISGGANSWRLNGGWDGAAGSEVSETIPEVLTLNDAYPNPFNASTQIRFTLPQSGAVKLDIYNLMGQKVSTLVNGRIDAGEHTVSWDASNYSSGVYFYKLTVGDRVFTKRMTLLK
ncbi:MAG: T9SS type A sorting domain-containing protein [candidate division Zixibacteria bacterium]|nr:T9SS type A sorting domain-containing protein [candidate division Zixibacteria bacterium]